MPKSNLPKPDLSQLEHLHEQNIHNSDNLNEDRLNELHAEDIDDELEHTMLRLSDYLAAVELVVKETFSHSVWVKAEIRNLSSKNGHYYFELAEKDDSGKVIASCRGNLWRFKAVRVLNKFKRATGMDLERDITVLLNVNATFHPQYGFSLNINDIDPSYTLGDLARQYAIMLERLSSEGLLNQNKQVPPPFDIEHVVVIAPEKAAGLGDFRADADRLARTGACQFHYHSATFQGNHAPKEIRHAISKSVLTFKKQYDRLPDLMVIIRGGGAVGDLAYLNDYELAALIAEQPIPVWVGIGHERDNVILDEVAHTSFDTPSKVIAAISSHLLQLMQRTQGFVDSIQQLSNQQLVNFKQASELHFKTIESASLQSLQQWQFLSNSHFSSIKQHTKFNIREAKTNSHNFMNTIQQNSYVSLAKMTTSIEHFYVTTEYNSKKILTDTSKQLRHYQQLTLVQNPTRLLNQGYALVKNADNKYISSAKDIDKGDFINIVMSDADLTTVVTDVAHKFDNGNDNNKAG